MMQRRRALTIPFVVDKDNLMEDPLKIPMAHLPSECGKLGQVSWTAFAGCQFRSRHSQQKNGSTVFHNSHATMITVEMARRKPLLILTDVLKTEMGKAHMERIKKSLRKQLSSPQKASRPNRELPATCREKSSQRETRNNFSSSLRSNQKMTPSSSQRPKSRRKLSNVEDKEDPHDIKEMIVGKEGSFSEVVDYGLSLSWKPNREAGDCDDLSSAHIEVRRTTPEKDSPQRLKRRSLETKVQCNGVRSSKRHRLLSLTHENREEGESSPTSADQDKIEEDSDLDRCILKFTVGGDGQTQTLVPFIETSLRDKDTASRSSVGLDRRSLTSPFEPIVLSSDDEGGDAEAVGHAEVTAKVTDILQKAACEEREDPDTQMTEEAAASHGSLLESFVFDEDCAGMSVAFWSLRCGGYRGNANGAFMITKDQVIIPLKDASGERQVVLSFERKDLRRYSVWEQYELEERGLHFICDGADFPAVLLICVSQTAAAAIQQSLCQLDRAEDGDVNAEKACPFLFLGLKDPLLGMEGALLRSILDLDCIKSLTHRRRSKTDESPDFEDAPVLSLDENLELIQRSGLDLDSLLMQTATRTSPDLIDDQSSLHSDADELPTAHIWLNTGEESKPEEPPEEEVEMQAEPMEDAKDEEELQTSPDDRMQDATPAYTLRHQRTKGPYSVSLCKPSSNWIPYKHQGVARRLIQFPPPPLKGGITVTMEDLQCLDSGKYLNDVIIDFYLKYLLLNTPSALSERCHVFSSFFYKQLTRRDNASEGSNSEACQRQRRHQRVKTWTRHVDIFEKDFLFVPVNQEAHWYLVIICFPGLDELNVESWTAASHSEERAGRSEAEAEMNGSNSVETEAENAPKDPSKDSPTSPVSCTEQTCCRQTVQKRPCILLMDSLKISLHERVVKLLREYLQSEWEVRRGSLRDFGPDQMKSSNCKVPLQDNSSDCGLYLLQYVECFLKDPVVHFDLPLQLQQWFPRQQVRRKRDEIRDLILNLYRHQQLDTEKS